MSVRLAGSVGAFIVMLLCMIAVGVALRLVGLDVLKQLEVMHVLYMICYGCG
jgi:hypothetical protein